MNVMDIFSDIIGFVIEELVIGAVIGIIWTKINYDVRVANFTGFQSTIYPLYLIFVCVLMLPILLHIDDLRELIGK